MKRVLVLIVIFLLFLNCKAEEFNTPTSTMLFCNLTQTCQNSHVNISEIISDLLLPGLRHEFISNHTSYFLDLFYNITLTPQEEKTWARITEKVESHLIPWIYRALNESNSVGVLASTSVSSISNINYNMEANILGPLRNELVREFQKVTQTFDVTENEVLDLMNVITQKVLNSITTEDGNIKQSIERLLNEVKTTIKSNAQQGYQKIHETSIKVSNSIFEEVKTTTDKLIILTENLHKDSEVLIRDQRIKSVEMTLKVKDDINATTEEISNEMNLMIQKTQEKSMNLLLQSMNRYESETNIITQKMKKSLKKNGDIFMEIAISCVWIYLMFMICFEMLPSKDDLKSMKIKIILTKFVRRILQISPSSFIFPGLFLLFEYRFENLNHVGIEIKMYIVTLFIVQVLFFSCLFLIAFIFQSIYLSILWWKENKPLEYLKSKIERMNIWEKKYDTNEGRFDYESNEHY
eukprot:gene4656-8229_t